MPVLPEVDGISMRPAGEPAPADERPEWSDSTTTWGLRAVGPSGGPVDVYLGAGENQAGNFSRAFSQAREELATNRRRMADKRRDRASETLTGTLKSLSPTRDSWKGAKYVVPESRAYTREFCVPSVDTHKVYMGFVEPVDLAKSMTQDGFNVRGVNLPLIANADNRNVISGTPTKAVDPTKVLDCSKAYVDFPAIGASNYFGSSWDSNR